MSKFDAARANGDMKPTATLGMGTTDGKILKHLFDINEKFEMLLEFSKFYIDK